MVPDIETRLKAILRSLQEVIIPAIDPGKQLANDQANIVVGNLLMLLDQHDKQVHYELAEIRDYSALLKELIKELQGQLLDKEVLDAGKALLEATAPVVKINLPTYEKLSLQNRTLKECVDTLLRTVLTDGQQDEIAATRKVVMQYAERQLLRERAWLMKAGFELDPNQIPTLDALLTNVEI